MIAAEASEGCWWIPGLVDHAVQQDIEIDLTQALAVRQLNQSGGSMTVDNCTASISASPGAICPCHEKLPDLEN